MSSTRERPGGADRPARPLDPRSSAAVLLGVLSVVLLAVVSMLPVPYAVMRPGPVRDVLGEHAGEPMIHIEGRRTYPTSGRLDLLTVAMDGGPGDPVGLGGLVRGWFSDARTVRPRAELFPPGRTQEDVDRENSREMVSSQEAATAAAMAELGIDVPTTLTVVGFTDEDAGEGHPVVVGDVITAVAGQPVSDLTVLRERLQEVPAGDPVEILLTRDGAATTVVAPTTAAEDGRTLLGVLVDPTYHFPFEVSIRIEHIGGPSAGMIFALGIVDLLTPGEMTGGQRIAGTGTVDATGAVGAIGGIRQKLVAASDAGAAWFLAPTVHCPEVVGHVPDGLRVIAVDTLAQARAAVETVGAGEDTSDLPGCPTH